MFPINMVLAILMAVSFVATQEAQASYSDAAITYGASQPDEVAVPVTFSWTNDGGVVIVATATDFGFPSPSTTANSVTSSSALSKPPSSMTTMYTAPAATSALDTSSVATPNTSITPVASSIVSTVAPPSDTSSSAAVAGSTASTSGDGPSPISGVASSIAHSTMSTVVSTTASTADSPSPTSSLASATSSASPPAVSVPPTAPGFPGIDCTNIAPGAIGNFTLTFDDEPTLDPNPDDESIPLFNPYHSLWFSNGFGTNDAPFANSTPNVVYFDPAQSTVDIGSPDAAGADGAEISSGPYMNVTAFWFNAYSVSFACDSHEDASCAVAIHMSGRDAGQVDSHLDWHFYTLLPPCPNGDCIMSWLDLAGPNSALVSVQIQATVNDQPVPFWMDNFAMGWSNNTCEAARARSMEE